MDPAQGTECEISQHGAKKRFLKGPRNPQNLLEPINQLSKVKEYKINTEKSIRFLFTSNK